MTLEPLFGETRRSRPMPVFVLSLARRTDRRDHMRALLDRLGLQAEFIDAVDGTRLTAAQRALYDRRRALAVYGEEMTDAEIACCLTHQAAYARIIGLRLPMALILEDDVECEDDLPSLLAALAASPAPPWQVLRLQSTKGCIIEGVSKGRGVAVAQVAGRTVSRIDAGILGGCGYVVTLEGARRLVRYAGRPFMPADQAIDRYWENGIDPYVLRPFPVRQCEAIASEIGVRKVMIDHGPYWTLARRTQRAVDGVAKRAYALRRRADPARRPPAGPRSAFPLDLAQAEPA